MSHAVVRVSSNNVLGVFVANHDGAASILIYEYVLGGNVNLRNTFTYTDVKTRHCICLARNTKNRGSKLS